MSDVLGAVILGNSPAIRELRAMIAQVAPTNHRVLIHGPSGSGKELVAEALHLLSGRRGRFVPINVCAIPETMFEATVFGHVKGAFTGATSDSRGFLREADGGTAFFDEISRLHVNNQGKVLRAIETRRFRPIGAGADQTSDFRLISATNEHLGTLAGSGHFRSDLLHRIGGIPLEVPSLSDRIEDIPVLVRHFVRQASHTDPNSFEVTDAALRSLQLYDWPGNVRQLRNVIEYASTVGSSPRIERTAVEKAIQLQRLLIETRCADRPMHGGGEQSDDLATVTGTMARGRYLALLGANGWRVGRTAAAIGVHRGTLSRHLSALGIDPAAYRRSLQLVAAASELSVKELR